MDNSDENGTEWEAMGLCFKVGATAPENHASLVYIERYSTHALEIQHDKTAMNFFLLIKILIHLLVDNKVWEYSTIVSTNQYNLTSTLDSLSQHITLQPTVHSTLTPPQT